MKVKDNNKEQTFWKIRARKYNKLQWVKNNKYLSEFIKAGRFRKTDVVLDVGTGTGVVAHAVSPYVDEVIGLDKSQDMLEHSNWCGNMYFVRRDLFDEIFAENVFDKITCRLVFHHILRNRSKAMDICYRMLKKGGMMVFSEGVPASRRVKKDYIEIFKLKEKRATFYPEDLEDLMKKSGFRNVVSKVVWLRKMSVDNWLAGSGLPKPVQRKIYNMHKYADNYFKEDYNMVETKDDCLIDMKMVIVTGMK
ncbi:class I SAM-dependent methyltransferase [Elusimicrobiota bacterium]